MKTDSTFLNHNYMYMYMFQNLDLYLIWKKWDAETLLMFLASAISIWKAIISKLF